LSPFVLHSLKYFSWLRYLKIQPPLDTTHACWLRATSTPCIHGFDSTRAKKRCAHTHTLKQHLKGEAYRLRNQKPRKQIKHWVESWRYNGGQLIIWGQSHEHHTQVIEVQQCAEHGIEVPENLVGWPVVINHWVCDNCEYQSHREKIGKFNRDLQESRSEADQWIKRLTECQMQRRQ